MAKKKNKNAEKSAAKRGQGLKSTTGTKVQSETAARKTGANAQSQPPKGAKVPIGGTQNLR